MSGPVEGGAKARVYVEALEALGFRPRVDADGDVTFRMEGRNLVIMADEDDPGFFRVLLPYFWNLSSAQERSAALSAALQLTGEYKAVKIFVDEE
ncbi:MAG TPA: hypothetical protein VHN99_09870, partial [Deinococcales bacterium]|nr:hypothetical protein [Deinococcales bacterium]